MSDASRLFWSELTRWRSQCHRRLGSIRDLPLRSFHEEGRGLLRSDSQVLDMGAGAHKPFQRAVSLPSQRYFSLDNDPEGDFDFRLKRFPRTCNLT